MKHGPEWNRVYYLDIGYPEGCEEEGWEPEDWDETRLFRWHKQRRWLSKATAMRRAHLLESFGCVVKVIEGTVSWDNPPVHDSGDLCETEFPHVRRAVCGLVEILQETT